MDGTVYHTVQLIIRISNYDP